MSDVRRALRAAAESGETPGVCCRFRVEGSGVWVSFLGCKKDLEFRKAPNESLGFKDSEFMPVSMRIEV